MSDTPDCREMAKELREVKAERDRLKGELEAAREKLEIARTPCALIRMEGEPGYTQGEARFWHEETTKMQSARDVAEAERDQLRGELEDEQDSFEDASRQRGLDGIAQDKMRIERDRLKAALEEARADDLRDRGWSVAVHNDYQQNGERFTFWLMTKNNHAVKGEGRTDVEALNQIRQSLNPKEPKPQLPSDVIEGGEKPPCPLCKTPGKGRYVEDCMMCEKTGKRFDARGFWDRCKYCLGENKPKEGGAQKKRSCLTHEEENLLYYSGELSDKPEGHDKEPKEGGLPPLSERFDQKKLREILAGKDLSPESKEKRQRFREWLDGAKSLGPEDLNLVLREPKPEGHDPTGQEEKCKTCFGQEKVPRPYMRIGGDRYKIVPCPTCKPKEEKGDVEKLAETVALRVVEMLRESGMLPACQEEDPVRAGECLAPTETTDDGISGRSIQKAEELMRVATAKRRRGKLRQRRGRNSRGD